MGYCGGQLSPGGTEHVNVDPRETLSRAPMSTLQFIAIAVTVGLNALDGFDVLSISFASPGIATAHRRSPLPTLGEGPGMRARRSSRQRAAAPTRREATSETSRS